MVENHLARKKKNIELGDLNKAKEVLDKDDGLLSVKGKSEFQQPQVEHKNERIQNNKQITESIVNNLKNIKKKEFNLIMEDI